VTTQHSLPSGRYPLLGPDFHRLDRTSLRLAHSFNDLVGAGEQRLWHIEAEGLRSLHVNDKIELGWLLDRNVSRLRSQISGDYQSTPPLGQKTQ
jgi:hypothetical protein